MRGAFELIGVKPQLIRPSFGIKSSYLVEMDGEKVLPPEIVSLSLIRQIFF